MATVNADISVPVCYAATTIVGAAVGAVGGAGAMSVSGMVLGAVVGAGFGRVLCGTRENPGILSRALAPYVNPPLDQFDVSKAENFIESLGVTDPLARKRVVQLAVRAHRDYGLDDSGSLPTLHNTGPVSVCCLPIWIRPPHEEKRIIKDQTATAPLSINAH